MKFIENGLYRADIEKTIAQVSNLSFFQGKRILILGATGLIGSFLTDCLIYANSQNNMNIHIYAVSRNRKNLIDRFGEESSCVHYVESPVEDLDIDIPIDIIIHAASNAHPKAFREKPVETMRANVLGTYQICELARRSRECKVLYVSSGEVQEEVEHLTPRACYPISKKAAETMCICYLAEYGVDVRIARPCHTFGANVTIEDNRATAQFISSAAREQDIIMNSAGQQRRSFAYVGDCVSGLLTILSCGAAGLVYGVASDEVYSIRQFAEVCAASVGKQVITRNSNTIEKAEASPIQQQIIDNEDLKKLGWKSVFSLEEGIRHSVQIQRQVGQE